MLSVRHCYTIEFILILKKAVYKIMRNFTEKMRENILAGGILNA